MISSAWITLDWQCKPDRDCTFKLDGASAESTLGLPLSQQ